MTFGIEKLLLSVLVGGLIGLEREFRDKAAGFRTIIFICLGTTMFTMISASINGADPSRIAAGLVTGIGFIGTGVIMQTRGQIMGLTTASIIWISAAIGMCVGLGLYDMVIISTLFTLAILWLFPFLEAIIQKRRESAIYSITVGTQYYKIKQIKEKVRDLKMIILSENVEKINHNFVLNIKLVGSRTAHETINNILIDDNEISSCKIF
jgi:putative Mg2+ transporter-C (MgtC) family protein